MICTFLTNLLIEIQNHDISKETTKNRIELKEEKKMDTLVSFAKCMHFSFGCQRMAREKKTNPNSDSEQTRINDDFQTKQ